MYLSDGALSDREALRADDRETYGVKSVVLLYPHRHEWHCLDIDLLFDAPQWARWECRDKRRMCEPCPTPQWVGWMR